MSGVSLRTTDCAWVQPLSRLLVVRLSSLQERFDVGLLALLCSESICRLFASGQLVTLPSPVSHHRFLYAQLTAAPHPSVPASWINVKAASNEFLRLCFFVRRVCVMCMKRQIKDLHNFPDRRVSVFERPNVTSSVPVMKLRKWGKKT